MINPVFGVYAYGEMELGKASDQKVDAQPRHTDNVDAEEKEK